ncbi:MAG: CorA family divalent cation transporter [Parachlamydiales bacterium]|jgi:magnesium transporter
MFEIYFKSIKDENFTLNEEFKVGSWINLKDTSMDDLNKICELTGLDSSDLIDSLDKYEIPRIEHIGDNIVLYSRHSSDLEEGLYTNTLTIILAKNYIITISPQKSKIIEAILESKINLATTQKSKVLLYILLKITHDFTTKIKHVRNTVIEHEYKMKSVSNKAIVVLTKNEEILNQYLSSLVPIRNLLEAISSGRYISLYEKDYDLLQDLMIAIKQSEDICSVSVKSIRSLRDAYQILFTNDVNKTIKLLTAITIIFTIPTIISSIYGMNINLPFASNSHAFLIIIIFTIFLSLFCTYIFARKRWL